MAATTFQIFKETALPGTLVPNAIYLITATNPNHVEMYVTDNAGTATRRIPTEADIQALINAAISGISAIEVVADITARDALTLTSNTQVLVIDASADPTVTSGAATYIWDNANSQFVKISEFESLDVVLDWNNLVNGPASSAAAIDLAVANSHTHANKTELDKIDEDVNGCVTYDGVALVQTGSLTW
jgi:hypothetical protein